MTTIFWEDAQGMRVTNVRITPIAIPDVPLANTKGVHQSVFLRAVIEVETDTGLVGLGETYGAKRTLAGLRIAAPLLEGLDPYDLRDLRARIEAALPDSGGINAPTALADHKLVDVVYSAFEIALLDIRGKEVGRPLCDLLGGAVRKTIPFAGYLFYKFAKQDLTFGPDIMGEMMTPDALVNQAREFSARYGFRSWKLKGGVLDPDLEVETMLKLREAFPGHGLRIDPMGAWTVPTALKVIERLDGILEYLEDPCRGMDAMADLSARTTMPLGHQPGGGRVRADHRGGEEGRGADHPVRSPLLARRHRCHSTGRGVPRGAARRGDALQFSPWHLAGRDVPCRRRHAEPDL